MLNAEGREGIAWNYLEALQASSSTISSRPIPIMDSPNGALCMRWFQLRDIHLNCGPDHADDPAGGHAGCDDFE